MTLKLDFPAEGVYGGALVGVSSADFIVFFDWEGRVVRRIDVGVKSVHWSDSGEYVAIVGEQVRMSVGGVPNLGTKYIVR